MDKHLQFVKQAKQTLGFPFLVRPREAISGCSGIVLAIKEHPNFACDHVFVRTPEQLADCLRVALTGKGNARIFTYQECIAQWMGFRPDGMKEIEIEEYKRDKAAN